MSTISNEILEWLTDDLVSHGLIAQSINERNAKGHEPHLQLDDVLKELLDLGRVEIGVAGSVASSYVEFIAWRGTVGERILRAKESVNSAVGSDREFAFWICLRENIDRFESTGRDTL